METLYRKVKNPKYQAYKKCKHENTHIYHDESIICRNCNCIISQYGDKINNPVPVGGHFESEYYFEEIKAQSIVTEKEIENILHVNLSVDGNRRATTCWVRGISEATTAIHKLYEEKGTQS